MNDVIQLKLQIKNQKIIGAQSIPRLVIEGSRKLVYLELEFDDEWTNCGIEVIFSHQAVAEDSKVSWQGKPVEVPPALLRTGELKISCIGHRTDGYRITTQDMPHGIQIQRAGKQDGRVPTPEENALWEQVLAAVGNLGDLKTVDKRSIVAAVNEIYGKAIEKVEELPQPNGDSLVRFTFENGLIFEYTVHEGKDGSDGVSPTVDVTANPDGHEVTITDKNGPQSFQVNDGRDGKDGLDGGEPAFAACYDEADPNKVVPNIWYVPKTMPRPSGKVGMMIDVQWMNGQENGLGYDVQLVWGEPDGADNEVVVDQTNTSDSLTGEYSIPVEGTVRYQLVEANGRKHWQYVSGPLLPRQFSTDTAAATADKIVPGMQLAYLPGQSIYVTLDQGNTASLMRLVPDEGPTLPVYTNGKGASTGEIPAGYICHLINAGDHWVLDNLGGGGGEVFWVKFDGRRQTSDKTFAEVKKAYDAGLMILGVETGQFGSEKIDHLYEVKVCSFGNRYPRKDYIYFGSVNISSGDARYAHQEGFYLNEDDTVSNDSKTLYVPYKLVVIASANPLSPDTYIADHSASEIRNADISGNMVELKYTTPSGDERLYRYEDFKAGQAVFRRIYPDTASGGIWTRANIMVNENKTIEIAYATGKAINPHTLTLTGAVDLTYNGSEDVTAEILAGGADYDIIHSGDPAPEPPASGKGFVIVEGENIPDPPTPGGDISLGLTGMVVGDKIEVASVDENGVPTSWKPEGKYELIEKGTWPEEKEFSKSKEPNGTPYNFKKCIAKFKNKSDKTQRNLYFRLSSGGSLANYWGTSEYQCCIMIGEIADDAFAGTIWYGRTDNEPMQLPRKGYYNQIMSNAAGNIIKIESYLPLGANTEYEIWAVRA